MPLIDFASFQDRTLRELQGPTSQQSRRGVLLSFPEVVDGNFIADMGRNLARFALTAPNIFPVQFGIQDDGAEFCRLTNGFTIGRNGSGRYSVRDDCSGYVDHGPFNSLHEVCRLVTWLGM